MERYEMQPGAGGCSCGGGCTEAKKAPVHPLLGRDLEAYEQFPTDGEPPIYPSRHIQSQTSLLSSVRNWSAGPLAPDWIASTATKHLHEPVRLSQPARDDSTSYAREFLDPRWTHTVHTPMSPINSQDERCQTVFALCSSFRNRLVRACREANRLSAHYRLAQHMLPENPDCSNPAHCAAQVAVRDALLALRIEALNRYANPQGEDRGQISQELMVLDGLLGHTSDILNACARGDYAELRRLECDNWPAQQFIATSNIVRFERQVIRPLQDEALWLRDLYRSCGVQGGCIDEAMFPFGGDRAGGYRCPNFGL